MKSSNNAIKLLSIIGIVVIAIAIGVVVFSCNQTIKDNKTAVKFAELSASTNYATLTANVTNEYSTVAPSALQTFIESKQSTEPTLYTRYYMATLSYTIQWQMAQSLINQTAYGGKKAESDNMTSLLNLYSDKMSSTLEAIEVFNQDKNSGTVSDEILKNESILIIKRLSEQNKILVSLNKVLLNFVISNNYASERVAKGDLIIALLNGAYRQGTVLQNAVDAYIKDQTIENQNDLITSNARIVIEAYKYAQNRKFVYGSINTSNGSQVEDFLTLYKNTKNVDDMLSSESPTKYISEVKDANQKTALNNIWTFFTKLAQGGV